MRAAVFLVVVALHLALFFVFALFRSPAPRSNATEVSSVAFFLPLTPAAETAAGEPKVPHPTAHTPARTNRPAAIAAPQPETRAITPSAPITPDWRHELEIAANNQLQSEQRRRDQPSPLAPHDFSKVKPGSTDDSKPQFGWSHSATHRVEEMPSGGLLININDRCAIAWVIFPFPV